MPGPISATNNFVNNLYETQGKKTKKKDSNLPKEPPQIVESEAQLYPTQRNINNRKITVVFVVGLVLTAATLLTVVITKLLQSDNKNYNGYAMGEFPLNCSAIINGSDCTSYTPK